MEEDVRRSGKVPTGVFIRGEGQVRRILQKQHRGLLEEWCNYNIFQLCEVSLIEWAPPHNAEDISAAVVSIVKQANVLDDSQAQEFHRSMERIVLPKDEDKIRMTKTFVHIAKRRKDAVNKIMNR